MVIATCLVLAPAVYTKTATFNVEVHMEIGTQYVEETANEDQAIQKSVHSDAVKTRREEARGSVGTVVV